MSIPLDRVFLMPVEYDGIPQMSGERQPMWPALDEEDSRKWRRMIYKGSRGVPLTREQMLAGERRKEKGQRRFRRHSWKFHRRTQYRVLL